jgi:hypothetical protein
MDISRTRRKDISNANAVLRFGPRDDLENDLILAIQRSPRSRDHKRGARGAATSVHLFARDRYPASARSSREIVKDRSFTRGSFSFR